MKGDFPYELKIKNITHSVHNVLFGMGCSENGTVPKRAQPIMTQTDFDVLHCPAVGETNSSSFGAIIDTWNVSLTTLFGTNVVVF